MVTIVQQLLAEEGNEIMQTAADYWIEQGVEQGIKQGEREAMRRMARRMLALHDVATVSEITGLPVEEVVALKAEKDTGH